MALQQEAAVINGEISLLQTENKTQAGQITVIQGQLASIQTDITKLENEAKAQDGKITNLQAQVLTLASEITNLSNAIVALQRAPNIADCGTLVLTCPVTTDTVCLSV